MYVRRESEEVFDALMLKTPDLQGLRTAVSIFQKLWHMNTLQIVGCWYLTYRKLDIRLLISGACFLLRVEMEIVSTGEFYTQLLAWAMCC